MAGPLRVCIDARMGSEGSSGGVQQVVIGLATGLALIGAADQEYYFLTKGGPPEWLRPHLRGPCRALALPPPPPVPGWKRAVKAIVPKHLLDVPFHLAALAHDVLRQRVPTSDGTIERAGMQVMHQTLQFGFRTDIPSIYMPYDLQHLHLPELFSFGDRRRKAVHYPTLAAAAASVVAISRWGKDDLVRSFGLPPEKVHVVHLAPAVDAYPDPTRSDLEELRHRHALPDAFVLYPAQTWRHKNHLGLLDALALLRDRDGLAIPAVFTGHRNDFLPVLERRVRALGLGSQVRFLGFVSPVELKALYLLCRLLAFPSRFEGFGMPVVEAFRLGVPVACSNATSLPEVAGDAALLFDPALPDTIADAIRRLWTDSSLRDDLVARGRERARAFTWTATARKFQALYRSAAGWPLDEVDRQLLDDTS